jgi:hypothetical protein
MIRPHGLRSKNVHVSSRHSSPCSTASGTSAASANSDNWLRSEIAARIDSDAVSAMTRPIAHGIRPPNVKLCCHRFGTATAPRYLRSP